MLNGVLLSLLCAYLLAFSYFLKKAKMRLNFTIDWAEVNLLMKIGIPIMGLSIINSFLFSIDRLMIASFLNSSFLGYYSIAITVFNLVNMLPGICSQVIYPQLCQKYGEVKSETGQLFKYIHEPASTISYILPILLSVIFIFYPVLIQSFLKSYIPSILILRILLVGVFSIALSGLFTDFLIVINKQKIIIIIQLMILSVNALIIYLCIKAGWGIIGVSIGVTCGYFIYGITMLACGLLYLGVPFTALFTRITFYVLPVIFAAGIIYILHTVIPEIPGATIVSSLSHGAVEFILFSIIYIPLVLLLDKKSNFIRTLIGLLKREYVPRISFGFLKNGNNQ